MSTAAAVPRIWTSRPSEVRREAGHALRAEDDQPGDGPDQEARPERDDQEQDQDHLPTGHSRRDEVGEGEGDHETAEGAADGQDQAGDERVGLVEDDLVVIQVEGRHVAAERFPGRRSCTRRRCPAAATSRIRYHRLAGSIKRPVRSGSATRSRPGTFRPVLDRCGHPAMNSAQMSARCWLPL